MTQKKAKAKAAKPRKNKPAAPRVTAEDRKRIFVEAYLLEPNASKAAIAAGYAKGSANVTGSRLLADANIQREIEKGRRASAIRTGINADWVRLRLAQIADAKLDDVAEWGTDPICRAHGVNPSCDCGAMTGRSWFRLKSLDQIPEDQRKAIASIKVKRRFTENPDDPEGPPIEVEETEVKLKDDVKALELLGKHLGMFDQKIAVKMDLPIDLSKLTLEQKLAFEALLDAASPDE